MPSGTLASAPRVRRLRGMSLWNELPKLEQWFAQRERYPLSQHPRWLKILHQALGHTVYALTASERGQVRGFLPLAGFSSLLFGRFLVSLPYLNTNGVMADDPAIERALVEEAIRLAEQRQVRFLELRQEQEVVHPQLHGRANQKVHMRLSLPGTTEALFRDVGPKVRNQVRKGEKSNLTIHWGRQELLGEFYSVFSQNMRDLGTPVYGRALFEQILRHFPSETELCVVRQGQRAVACALLLHGRGITEVPSASCLREVNPLCANMLMYWHLLQRSIERKQTVFDFGRCTLNGGPYKFKCQWGAQAHPAHWQYYTREGQANEMRPDNPRFAQLIRLWQQLPVALTRFLGPSIVRCIP